ncbi:MAG: sugar transferase, partial [bacterium]
VGSEMIDTHETLQRKINLKPGLTGLVQVNLDSCSTLEEKEKYDIFYMKNYSPLLDAEIIFKSIFKL